MEKPAGSKGQTLVLIGVAFVVLLGFVGLTTDVGRSFIIWATCDGRPMRPLSQQPQYREGRLSLKWRRRPYR
jgi:hypothetical protein